MKLGGLTCGLHYFTLTCGRLASGNGHPATASALLEGGAAVDYTDNDGDTAHALAVQNGGFTPQLLAKLKPHDTTFAE